MRGDLRHLRAQQSRIAEVVLAGNREEFLRRFRGIGVDRGFAAGIHLRGEARRTRAWKSRAHSRCQARGSGGVPSSTPSSASSLCAISCTATQKPACGFVEIGLDVGPGQDQRPAVPGFADQFVLPFVQHAGGVDMAAVARGRHRDRRSAATSRAVLRAPNSSSGKQHSAASMRALDRRPASRPATGVMVFVRRKRAVSIAQARIAPGVERGDPAHVRLHMSARDRDRELPRGNVRASARTRA